MTKWYQLGLKITSSNLLVFVQEKLYSQISLIAHTVVSTALILNIYISESRG